MRKSWFLKFFFQIRAADQNFTSLVGGQALVEEDQGLPPFLRLDQVQQAGLVIRVNYWISVTQVQPGGPLPLPIGCATAPPWTPPLTPGAAPAGPLLCSPIITIGLKAKKCGEDAKVNVDS